MMLTARFVRSVTLVALAAGIAACEKDPVDPGTGTASGVLQGNVSANRTLTKDTVYVLKGYVKVQNGATLTIQAGTKIVGDTTTPGSSLWILRGGRIMATGSATEPIVFTSQRSAPNRKPGDWGGIIMIGNGIINRTGAINTEGPSGVSENYGQGDNNADNSGQLRYVRIEFAGFDVTGTGSELNGLSMYAVGSGTLIEYVQVLAGLDDSFEWWGGAVDGRYLVSYESGDDHFDWTEGWQGRVQYAIALQTARLQPAPNTGSNSSDPQGFEADGCSGAGCATNTFRSTPYSYPIFANFAIVGMAAGETQASGGFGAVLRRGTAGFLTNGIFAKWKGTALSVRDAVTDTLLQRDSLVVANIIFAENTGDYDPIATNFGQSTKFTADNHRTAATAASLFTSLATSGLDWAPAPGSISATGGGTVTIPAARTGGFFGGTLTNTTFVGPADPAGPKWWTGWTAHATN